MKPSIYSQHRFQPDIIRRAICMFLRFNLSFRDVEALMAQRGVDLLGHRFGTRFEQTAHHSTKP